MMLSSMRTKILQQGKKERRKVNIYKHEVFQMIQMLFSMNSVDSLFMFVTL